MIEWKTESALFASKDTPLLKKELVNSTIPSVWLLLWTEAAVKSAIKVTKPMLMENASMLMNTVGNSPNRVTVLTVIDFTS